MPPARSPLAAILTRSSVASLALLVGGLVGVQAWRPPLAAAAPTSGPTAVNDSTSMSLNQHDASFTKTPAVLAGATNDRAGSAAIVLGLTVFPADQVASLPKGSSLSSDGKTLQVVDHGTFRIRPDGAVEFTPWSRHTGPVSVHYRIVDAGGATADGLLTVVVDAGGELDGIETHAGVDVIGFNLLANDTPGRNADGTLGTLDPASVQFGDQQYGAAGTVSNGRHTLTIPGVGVATLDGGLLTFRSSEVGRNGTFTYEAQDTTVDGAGQVVHHQYSVAGYFENDPNYVFATNDSVSTPFDTSATLPGILNDSGTNPKHVLRPELSVFDTSLLPGGSISPDRRTVKVAAGRGTWSINADGSVSYLPGGYVGQDTALMLVHDSSGLGSSEELTVTVEPGPTAGPDTVTVAQDVTTSVNVLANDVPGKDAHGKAGSMDATSVRFPTDGQPAGAVVTDDQRTLTVPGQGAYTADKVTGKISFDPAPQLVGKAKPVTYTAQDTVTRADGTTVVHNPTRSTLTVTVTAVTPVALNNWATTQVGQAVDIPVLANDRPGAASVPLDTTSVRLRTTAGLPSGSILYAGAQSLRVAGRGTFAVRPGGTVRFTPVTGFTGRVPTVGYSVADRNGTRAVATITVQVNAP